MNLISLILICGRERLIDAHSIAVVLHEVLETVTTADNPQVVFLSICFFLSSLLYLFIFHFFPFILIWS
jgi:hypothetical protein